MLVCFALVKEIKAGLTVGVGWDGAYLFTVFKMTATNCHCGPFC